MNKVDKPKVTVLMAVNNGIPYLSTAIDSILSQTYNNYQFLIVDDGSVDGTPDLIRSYHDERIRLICLGQNVGQTAALNVGLGYVVTDWIARMDSDDYSDPTRLEIQVKVMESNPGIDCFGTFGWTFRDDPQIMDSSMVRKVKHPQIKQELLKGSPIIHGSILVSRRSIESVGGYNEEYRYSADLELYERLLSSYRAENIPIKLLGVRRHNQQGSLTTKAFDEVIRIFSNRLTKGHYSASERKIIRTSLCRYYLVRSQLLLREGRIIRVARDLLLAVQTDLGCLLINGPAILIAHYISEINRARLKNLATFWIRE